MSLQKLKLFSFLIFFLMYGCSNILDSTIDKNNSEGAQIMAKQNNKTYNIRYEFVQSGDKFVYTIVEEGKKRLMHDEFDTEKEIRDYINTNYPEFTYVHGTWVNLKLIKKYLIVHRVNTADMNSYYQIDFYVNYIKTPCLTLFNFKTYQEAVNMVLYLTNNKK